MLPKTRKRKTLEYIIEFILVVLGISMAFWLGERAEKKKEGLLQTEYLQNLLIDLNEDIDLIDYLTVLNQGRSTILKAVEDFEEGVSTDLTLDSIPDLVVEMSDFDLFYPNDFTYVTLKQSGDFKIIKSQNIRSLLVKLYSSYESIEREQNNLVTSLDSNFFPDFYKSYKLATNEIINRSYFNSASLANYVGFTRTKFNTISIYFDRSKILAEQAVAAIEEVLR